MGDSIRLDIWLDVACLFRTRSEAKRACEGGKIDVNGEHAKPNRLVREGDRVRISRGAGRFQDIIVALNDIGYRVPARFSGLAKLENARVYVSGRNLATFTKYTGYNPEVNSAGSDANVIIGTDYYAYPLARTFTIGISAGW